MKDRRGERSTGARLQYVAEMAGSPRSARSDDRYAHGLNDVACVGDVIPGPKAVLVHAVKDYFSRAALSRFLDPIECPAARAARRIRVARILFDPIISTLSEAVDPKDNALAPEITRQFLDQLRPLERGGVDRYLVGTTIEAGSRLIPAGPAPGQRD